ncbi:hypothetical protein P0Y35_12585 [Kiritimatiellaeota bacterium B1221]|nr:hypothetical protein [Kiritimatiellaeota bacterium B1221]
MADQIFIFFNLGEACLWFFMALFVFRQMRKGGRVQTLGITGVTLVIFGLSDLIELQTGAWWRPWELLAMKGFCLITFLGCYLSDRYSKKDET